MAGVLSCLTIEFKIMKILVCLLIVMCALNVEGQQFVDLYKKGKVNLVVESSYGATTDWKSVFKWYDGSMKAKKMLRKCSFNVLKSGRVIVCDPNVKEYIKLDEKGRVLKRFGIGKSSGEQMKFRSLLGVLDSGVCCSKVDGIGSMVCFDSEGGYLKTLKLDYMVSGFVALPNNKFAVKGTAIWKDRIRSFVSIVDYSTNEEKVVWERFVERDSKDNRMPFSYRVDIGKSLFGFSLGAPFRRGRGYGDFNLGFVDGKILVSLPVTGEVFQYDQNGVKLDVVQLDWTRKEIGKEEQEGVQKKVVEQLRQKLLTLGADVCSKEEAERALVTFREQFAADLAQVESPLFMPYFVTSIIDSDGNVLYFVSPSEEDKNEFKVFALTPNRKVIATSSFVCRDFDLVINSEKLQFRDNYLYGLQATKKGDELRMVRFRLGAI